jgi:hypothetical protein
MKSIGLSLCQLRSSWFHFIDLFPPKESMKEFVENRGRQDGTGPPDKYCRHFLTVGTQPHLSNIDIVVAIPRTLQTFAGNRRGTSASWWSPGNRGVPNLLRAGRP